MPISKFNEAIDVERQIRRAERAAPEPMTPQQEIVQKCHDEHAWRARGEFAIRQEMDRRIARRRTK